MRNDYTDEQLMYAESARCTLCNAGLAHPLDHNEAMKLRAWVCSGVLKGVTNPMGHESLDFAFYKVREETSVNGPGQSTRPPGTAAYTVGKAQCPKCSTEWSSEPYKASSARHHWAPGACPHCGYAVGAGLSWSSGEGPAISTRYPTVVIKE